MPEFLGSNAIIERVVVELTNGSTPTYGTDAQQVRSGTHLLWAGDLNMDGIIKNTGAVKDRDIVLVNIGGTIPTNSRVEQLA